MCGGFNLFLNPELIANNLNAGEKVIEIIDENDDRFFVV